jgi:protein involved in polysaccharide export with SLBB domain
VRACVLGVGLSAVSSIALADGGAGPGLPEYRLSPGDVIDLSVFAQGDLSRQYRVRDDGTISLHLVGPVAAAGLTAEALEASLEESLSAKLAGPVSATVEVVSYRPIFILGDVRTPGRQPFSEGLDVLGALALAGGLPVAETGATAAMRVTDEEGAYRQQKARLAALLIERARLLAERAGASEIPPVAEAIDLIDAEHARTLSDEQARLMVARRDLLDIQIKSYEERQKLAQLEAESFAGRRELTRRQLDATLSDLADQEKLQERGLATASRLLELRVEADGYRSDELEAAAFEAAARQKNSDAGYAARSARIERTREIDDRVSQVEQEILDSRTALAAAADFLVEFGGQDALLDSGAARLAFRLTRRGESGPKTSEVGADTLLLPGDVVEVVVESIAPGATAPGDESGCITCGP